MIYFYQAVEKKAKSLGLTQLIRENEIVEEIVKRLMVLPLLPDGFIGIGWEMTKLLIDNNFPQQVNLKQLSDYIKDFWLEREFKLFNT